MKSYKFIFVLGIALLSACQSPQNQADVKSTPSISTPQPSQTSLLPEKAEKVCGDRPPTDPKAYPVSFYPVSVEYSDKNLEVVQKHFCEDAIKIKSKSLGKEVVQVASFTSQEKANSFKEKLSQHFSQATIGEPTILEKLKSDVDDRKARDEDLDTIESISKAALLNNEQVEQLLDLEKSRKILFKGFEKPKEVGKIKVLVPTYIPSNFYLVEFSRISLTPISKDDMRYRLRYKSSNGEAFDIANFEILGDGPVFVGEFGELEHPLLGKIRLWYSSYDGKNFRGDLSFQVPYSLCYQGQKTGYYFYSGETNGIGKTIAREEAVKIVQSLKPLNPRTKFDSLEVWSLMSEHFRNKPCISENR